MQCLSRQVYVRFEEAQKMGFAICVSETNAATTSSIYNPVDTTL
jgi:hypothetical protein